MAGRKAMVFTMPETGSARRLRGPAAVLSPEECRRLYAELGKKSNNNRLTLTHEETAAIPAATAALVEAYALLQGVAARAAAKAKPSESEAA
jgi:hypothetical protein